MKTFNQLREAKNYDKIAKDINKTYASSRGKVGKDKDGVDTHGIRVVYEKDGYRVQQLTEDGLGDTFVVIKNYKQLLLGWSAKVGGNKKTALKLKKTDKFKWTWAKYAKKYAGQAGGMLQTPGSETLSGNTWEVSPVELIAWLKKEGIKESVELDEIKEPFAVIHVDTNVVVATSSSEKDAEYAAKNPLNKKNKGKLKVVKTRKKQNHGYEFKEAKQVSLSKKGEYNLVANGKTSSGIMLSLQYNGKQITTGTKMDGMFVMAFDAKFVKDNKLDHGAKIVKKGKWTHVGFKKADDVIAYAVLGGLSEEVINEVNNGLGSFVSQMKKLLKDPKAKKAHRAASSLIMRAQEKGPLAKTAVKAIKKALPGLAKKAGGKWEKKILGMRTMLIEEKEMKTFESLRGELTEAKAKGFIGTKGNNNYAVSLDGADSSRPDSMDVERAAHKFKKVAKKGYAGSKGKATIPAVKKEIKMLGATQYYAKWQKDSSSYKDDTVTIYYTK